ncbi:MAG: sensor histidine kinase [Rhodospirillaceae bacterium]
MKAGYSLRFRLLAAAAVSIALALAVAGVVLSDLFETHLRERFDHEVAGHLDQLAANLGLDDQQRPVLERSLSDHRFQRPLSGLYWQVLVEGKATLRSRSLWDTTLTLPSDVLADGDLHRHETVGPGGMPVIVVERSVQLPGAAARFRLAAAESRSVLDRARAEFDGMLVLALGMLTLFLTLAAAIQVTIGLRPLARLRTELAEIRASRRKSFDAAVPIEVQPLVDDLNHLIAHSAEVVERARVQAGNLAHALKTGLAVIGNDLDGLNEMTARRFRSRLDDMLRHINHHLGRARAAGAGSLPGWRTKVASTIAALTRTLASLHGEKELSFKTECDQNLIFSGEKEDLEEILGNILDNACKWTTDRVMISARRAGQSNLINLIIEDNGPGLPVGAEEAIIKRGVRLDETMPGSGLGLGIVRDLCELYGGTLEFSKSGFGGLKVSITLPGEK